jgi:hypothetical protein
MVYVPGHIPIELLVRSSDALRNAYDNLSEVVAVHALESCDQHQDQGDESYVSGSHHLAIQAGLRNQARCRSCTVYKRDVDVLLPLKPGNHPESDLKPQKQREKRGSCSEIIEFD